MKIAELFYPKELKEIIADLRAKDDLNGEALKGLNKNIYLALLIWSITLWKAYVDEWQILFLMMLIAMPFMFWKVFKGSFEEYMLPYIKGEKAKGIVSDIKYYPYRTLVYYVNIPQKNKTYQINRALNWRSTHRPKINDPMTIYINPKRQGTAMPDHPYFKTKYQLQRSKLNSQRKS